MKIIFRLSAAALALAAWQTSINQAHAQNAAYYNGKSFKMIIGFGPGGGYDRWGRTVARHIGRHLPGKPQLVPQNMPGAGSIVALNYMSSVAPKDGTVMGIVARDAPLGPLTGMKQAKFDPLKMSWIGTPAKETNVCIAHKSSPIKTYADLLKTEYLVGDTGPGTGTHVYPTVLRELMGLKFKLIAGYPSSVNVFIAMERGEVHGICESLDSVISKHPTWIADKTLHVLFQAGSAPDPIIPGVPMIFDLAKTEDQKKALRFLYAGQAIGRPFVAPPGLSPEALKMLRDAFNVTMKDAEFLAEAKKLGLDIDAETGESLAKSIRDIYETPKELIAKISGMMKK